MQPESKLKNKSVLQVFVPPHGRYLSQVWSGLPQSCRKSSGLVSKFCISVMIYGIAAINHMTISLFHYKIGHQLSDTLKTRPIHNFKLWIWVLDQ